MAWARWVCRDGVAKISGGATGSVHPERAVQPQSRGFWMLMGVLLLSTTALGLEAVPLLDGQLSFDTPLGFRAWTVEEIAQKYPNARPPQHVYANERGTVSIALTHSETAVAPAQLSRLQLAMEQLLPRTIPGLEWIAREMLEINGQPWVHFELTSFAVDTDIHNHMYLTSLDGRMLGVNMNSTVSEYDVSRDVLARSRDILRVGGAAN